MKNNIESIYNIEKINIDTSTWKEYNFNKIFEIKRGLCPSKPAGKGDIPYVSSSSFNNGITDYVIFNEKKIIEGNVITVANNGSVGETFYQKKQFMCSTDVTILKINKLNERIALFLIPIIKKIGKKYGYENKFSISKMEEEIIYLPSKLEKEEYVPDWEYMENYIKEIEKQLKIKEIKNKINSIKKIEKEKIEISEWKEFNIDQLFNIEKGTRLNQSKRKKGKVPFLTATSENNGVSNYIDPSILKMNIKKDAITIDMFFNVFYHGYDFLCDDNVHILTLKEDILINRRIGMFLISSLIKNKNKYHYGQQLRIKNLIKETIYLPSKKEKDEIIPDWEYMENYIKELENKIESNK